MDYEPDQEQLDQLLGKPEGKEADDDGRIPSQPGP
jgi:hypothetical protein